jgi:predicted phosphodiesterase
LRFFPATAQQLCVRYALIGDVHCSPLLRKCLDFVRSNAVDLALCVGDLCDGEGSLSDTISLLHTHPVGPVRCVRGNHERWLLTDRFRDSPHAHKREALSADELAWIQALPIYLAFEDDSIVLTHALFEDDMTFVRQDTNACDVLDVTAYARARRRLPSMRVLVTGHTHSVMVRSIDGVLFINPGSLVAEPAPSFAIFDSVELSVRLFEFVEGSIVERAMIPLSFSFTSGMIPTP